MENKYFLEAVNDKRDMAPFIAEKLSEYGVCELGAGTFYVSGVDMPDDSAIKGQGYATKVILMPEIESGYAIKMMSRCMVKDIFLTGSEEKIELPTEVGTRHGILFEGNVMKSRWNDAPWDSMIEGCQMTGFTGGGITCVDTGYYIRASIAATNCRIINCGAGINISHFSEYHKFTNMICCENLYGCINNGGNNVFVNCGFDGNGTAFFVDNSRGQSNNNTHGSAVGCTFNHSGDNKGIGVHILGAQNGYVFSGCQMFYSKIVLEDTAAMTFNAMNFGSSTHIIVKGGMLTTFLNSSFLGEPTIEIEDNDAVKFVNCFLKDGSELKVE